MKAAPCCLLNSHGSTPEAMSLQPVWSEESSRPEEHTRWEKDGQVKLPKNECLDVLYTHTFSVYFMLYLWGKASMKQYLWLASLPSICSVFNWVYKVGLFV